MIFLFKKTYVTFHREKPAVRFRGARPSLAGGIFFFLVRRWRHFRILTGPMAKRLKLFGMTNI